MSLRELSEKLPPAPQAFNFGDIVDAVSEIVPPSAPAFVHGERVIDWGTATKRMNNIARNLHARGRQARRQGRLLHAQRHRVWRDSPAPAFSAG